MPSVTTLVTEPLPATAVPPEASELIERVEFLRLDASRRLNAARRGEMGQFLTPAPLASLMASMFVSRPTCLHVLDAGAGIGGLSTALTAQACHWDCPPRQLHISAYEVEPLLIEYLREIFDLCASHCRHAGVEFLGEVRNEDFVGAAVNLLDGAELFPADRPRFNAAVLNPPYRKINSGSETRRRLSAVDVQTSNLYTAFLWLTQKLLDWGGELVAITPRSFCNGPYFRPFRKAFLESMSVGRVHLFESRGQAFSGDDVLQENVVFQAIKGQRDDVVTITCSPAPDDQDLIVRKVAYDCFVRPDDPDLFIHIAPDELADEIAEAIRGLDANLDDLGLSVSTGRVVDFRSADLLRADPADDTAPLVHPAHLCDGFVKWPKRQSRKANALALGPRSEELLVPSDYYVLVRRFSAKEEPRRVVAAVFDPSRVPGAQVGFENHLNYFHRAGRGLDPVLAKGLAAYLNSTLVDCYFRQFNGHTQVNAADLRSLRYPCEAKLLALGRRIDERFPTQDGLDELIEEELPGMAAHPIKATRKIAEARAILAALTVPREQQNDRSALTLLALLDMKPGKTWNKASSPLRGITEMMDYFRAHFGIRYAPNTRETVRRFTIHQFMQMGIVIANPDDPARPVNSPDNRYQIEPAALEVIRTFRTRDWEKNLVTYLESLKGLRRLHAREREMKMVPVTLPDGSVVTLTAGGQNILIKDIIERFCPRFTPGGKVIAFGDAGDKLLGLSEQYLVDLGVRLDRHGKMPDVVVHYTKKGWLVLIEAVTSHGPMNLKRHNELKDLFKGCRCGLVFVTAFLTRKAMVKYLGEIAWETEVWVAESPSHLIHFNGERFLGPYASGG